MAINDLFNQCAQLFNLSPQERYLRHHEMCTCNHGFMWLTDDNERKEHVYECLKCGMTNKFRNLELHFMTPSCKYTVETLEYEAARSRIEDGRYNIINPDRPSNMLHPRILYQVSRELNLFYSLDDPSCYHDLFSLIERLRYTETPEESYSISTFDDCKDLIARYKKKYNKTYKKEIK